MGGTQKNSTMVGGTMVNLLESHHHPNTMRCVLGCWHRRVRGRPSVCRQCELLSSAVTNRGAGPLAWLAWSLGFKIPLQESRPPPQRGAASDVMRSVRYYIRSMLESGCSHLIPHGAKV